MNDKETIIIDGYNLIPALPTLGRSARRDLKKSRDSLVELLRDFRTRLRPHPFVLVVFDGKAAHETKRESPRSRSRNPVLQGRNCG